MIVVGMENAESNIHSTAIVHPNAKLGKDVIVGPGAVIGENVEIGDGHKNWCKCCNGGWTPLASVVKFIRTHLLGWNLKI